MTRAELPPMLLPVEVQAALGGSKRISIRTIRRRAKDKKIPGAIWLGTKLYFQRGPVMAWIEGGAQASVLRLVDEARLVG